MAQPPLHAAALGLARTVVYNDDALRAQRAHLAALARAHAPLAPHLDALAARLTADNPHPETGHVRRAALLLAAACPKLRRALAFVCAELLAFVTTGAAAAVRVSVDARVAAQPPRGARHSVVLLASESAEENVHRLAALTDSVAAFVARAPIPPDPPYPALRVDLCRGAVAADAPRFDRMRCRLALRLLALRTDHLGWAAPGARGATRAPHAFHGPPGDPRFDKRLLAADVSGAVACNVANGLLSRAFMLKVADVLKRAVDALVVTTRVILLSSGSWLQPRAPLDPRHVSDHVRLFTARGNVRVLEARVDLLSEWDGAVLAEALLHGVSASLLVFRFDSLDALAGVVGRSKAITDRFPGLTSDVSRVMYVDTASTAAFDDAFELLEDLAVDRRLLEPGTEDVVFEAESPDGPDIVTDAICERVAALQSIVHAELSGPARPHLETIVHVLNREVDIDATRAESADVIAFLQRLRSGIHTKVSVRRDPSVVTIARGDNTGYSLAGGGLSKFMRIGEYHDFRDVSETVPFTVEARVQLGKEVAGIAEVKRFAPRWRVITRMETLVRECELALAVADERKVVLERSGRGRFVTGVYVTILGGGLTDFLHGKMIRGCVEAVRADKDSTDLNAVRALLRLIPGLASAAYVAKEYGAGWNSR